MNIHLTETPIRRNAQPGQDTLLAQPGQDTLLDQDAHLG